MDILFIVLGIILLILGIAGAIAPVLPGPALAYASLWMLQFSSYKPFSDKWLGIWAVVMVLITIADYVIPAYGTKKLGGTKYGTYGSIVGLILGLIISTPTILLIPAGILLGPFIGAFVGELLGGAKTDFALKSGLGAFLGFIAGTFMKFVFALTMCGVFISGFF